MTVSGAVNKTILLTLILLVTTFISYAAPSALFMYTGIFGGIAVVLFASYKPHLSMYLAPLYAALEGLFVGTISFKYAAIAGTTGVIFNAVTLTMALLFAMLFLYKTGLIKVTEKFRSAVLMATGAIFLVYILNFALSFFGMSVPFLHESGMIGIGISLFIIGIACMNLLLDFDNFDKGEQYGAPKYMEWYSAMGLLVTLVWLYWEILRLLAMFAAND